MKMRSVLGVAYLTLSAAACIEPPEASHEARSLLDVIEDPLPPEDDTGSDGTKGIRGGMGLRINPGKPTGFADLAGNPVWLTGIAVAGGPNGYPVYGWPWASDAILTQAAGQGANYAHFRLGPFRTQLEDGANGGCVPTGDGAGFEPYAEAGGLRYDLDTWNAAYWSALRQRVQRAEQLGVYVEIDLIDAWALKNSHRTCNSAWHPDNNIQGFSLDCTALRDSTPGAHPHVRRWLEKIADELGPHGNVIFQIGNETDLCPGTTGASAAWERGVVQIVEARMAGNGSPAHLFGTNGTAAMAGLPEVDYVNRHSATAVEIAGGKPTGVNEDDQNSSPDRFMREAWESFSRGTFYHYWFGGNDGGGTVAATLQRMAAFRQFVDSVPHGQYRPLSQGVVGIPGNEWFAFSRTGAVLPPIDLGPTVRSFRLDWIDPRTAAVGSTTTFTGSGVQTFAPPSAQSWALRVRVVGGGSCTGSAGYWNEDRFDALVNGPLAGQSCWAGSAAGFTVVNAATGKEVLVDPPSGGSYTLSVDKGVPVQAAGRHRIEISVRVPEAIAHTTPVGKLEVQNGGADGTWNKVFQLYVGRDIRLNYAPAGNATLVSGTAAGATYRIRADLDLATGRIDAYVNGAQVAANLTMGITDRRIVSMHLIGFDEPGRFLVDDVTGAPLVTSPPPTITITAPPSGSTVSGIVPITATTSAGVQRVEFYEDSVLIGTDATAPFAMSWDTRVNPLPAPNHVMDFGYYFVEWKNPALFAAARAETNYYTNTYYATLATYATDQAPNYAALLHQSLATAVAEGRRIHLNLELNNGFAPYVDLVLDVARPYWGSVVRVELADEPNWDLATTSAHIAAVDQKLAARGLARPPGGYGITYVYTQPIPAAAAAGGLAWVGIEGYLNFPGSPDSEVNIAALAQHVNTSIAQVPAGKNIVLIPMAYDRNGAWTNIDTLRDLQVPEYLLVAQNPRVIALNMFSYTRAGGSRDHADLRGPHRMIAERIFDRTIPCATDGKHTIRAKAFNADGASASAQVIVNVVNSATCVPPPAPWELDTFDNLNPGPLHGQNGWIASGQSPIVGGGALSIDATGGQTIQINKNVADQTSGRHRVSFRVRVDGVVNASVAKLELRTGSSSIGWDKLAQIYVGTGMRLNYHSSGAAASVIPTMAYQQWYTVAFDIDLANRWVDVTVDGAPVATHVPVYASSITELQLAGWDLPGWVQIDDLRGEPLP